jgi:hypothetical protein
MCPSQVARIEAIVQAGDAWRIHLVTDHGTGQARTVLSFDHEPSRGEVEQEGKKWLKSLHSPPSSYDIAIGGGE